MRRSISCNSCWRNEDNAGHCFREEVPMLVDRSKVSIPTEKMFSRAAGVSLAIQKLTRKEVLAGSQEDKIAQKRKMRKLQASSHAEFLYLCGSRRECIDGLTRWPLKEDSHSRQHQTECSR
ncbi:uncharacterized protein LOC143821874 [Paroedura picta]|uniref:uncharacterized protein LOC143821874 n=1 Tax=Paroedura picta TaxID=143630 RepID=UPI004055B6B7